MNDLTINLTAQGQVVEGMDRWSARFDHMVIHHSRFSATGNRRTDAWIHDARRVEVTVIPAVDRTEQRVIVSIATDSKLPEAAELVGVLSIEQARELQDRLVVALLALEES